MMSYWGKAERDGLPESPFHLLVFHSLDVAAVAECLLQRMPWLVAVFLRVLGLPASERETLVRTIVFLTAIHDIGKFANGFQKMRPEVWERFAPPQERTRGWNYGGLLHHGPLGAALLDKGIVRSWFRGNRPTAAIALRTWIYAVCGHHGSPPDISKARQSLRSCFSERNEADAEAFVAWALASLGPDRLPVLPEAAARRSSMLLAGLVSVADWIGSNRDWFPFSSEAIAPEAYWQQARRRATDAVDEAGVVPRRPVTSPTFADLYPEITDPSPLQAAVDGLAFDSQCLVFVEEMTGGGKTEAANLIAAKLMAGGAAHGLYLAMPTTATADAMAEREADMYRRFFAEDGASFAVLHSKGGKKQAELTDTHGSTCAAWMTEDRRRKTVAEVCVGTIDQALLAALPSKFAAVRLFGLMGKVFVVDEAHSYDGYTQEILIGAVRLLAAAGASVVLVSATLSKAVKRSLADAFCEGAGFPLGDANALNDDRYPLITVLDRNGLRDPVATAPTVHAPRPKMIRMVRSVAEAEDVVLKAARAGKCVMWSRNTVDDANEAARRLRDLHGHADVTVYHARLPDGPRLRTQDSLLRRYGKTSRGAERASGIVVATQILESSFDVDFDLVVADLKPVDSVMQTAGRGCRHPRDQDGDPLPRDGRAIDAREPHEVVVVSPDPAQVRSAAWYSSLFPRAAWVYPNAGQLWRTAKVLEDMGEIAYPCGMRPLIEAVFGSDETPEPLLEGSLEAEGEQAAERSLARPNLQDPGRGYEPTIAWGDDQRMPTRLGVSIEIVLVQDEGTGRVQPFDGDDWSSGCMRLSSRRVTGTVPHGLSEDVVEAIASRAGHAEIVLISLDPTHAVWRGGLQSGDKIVPFTVDGFYGLEWR
ncbi:CRISPR-associated helicase Cas3' (plasmid) [Azospirillum argentinense]|uniref:CRISPR-associated helicase Cas3 n=1 Tax=Azospirillum argentinense TaxID=2970906 RepID=A0A4D8PYH5_9PROT|nr:CRISPR-associated helicase Cas3' [Azospirillum argentinense]QCO00526.1 CRISPR-associated helicase Cas3' [Azospirillum argentinense]